MGGPSARITAFLTIPKCNLRNALCIRGQCHLKYPTVAAFPGIVFRSVQPSWKSFLMAELQNGELIAQVRLFGEGDWEKVGHHPEYKHYTPYFQLRHTLAHDHYHIYGIERLWLTTEEYWAS